MATSLSSLTTGVTASSTLTPTRGKEVWEPPKWLMGMVAGGLTFLIIVAAVLMCAQFPWISDWLMRTEYVWRWRRARYERVHQDEEGGDDGSDENGGLAGGGSTARHQADQENQVKQRKRPPPPRLQPQSDMRPKGLAITMPGDAFEDRPQLRRNSLDGSLTTVTKSPMAKFVDLLTAPLPSVRASPRRNSEVELERGLQVPVPFGSNASTNDAVGGPKTNHQRARNAPAAGRAASTGSFLATVNEGLDSMAGWLAKSLHDDVTGPEEGLLLRVRDSEMESTASRRRSLSMC